ncbi:MAG: carbohydrate kinase family protein [Bacillota bacterium]
MMSGGEKGVILNYENRYLEIPPVEVEVIDTVGAGDAFCAGFIHHLSQGQEPHSAAQFGNFMGAFIASHRSGVPEYSKKEVVNKMNNQIG